ncbi:hypothetical protein GCM10027067_01950 [Pseudactinotalea suaedae]
MPSDRCGLHEPLPGWAWRPRLRDFDVWMVRGGRGRAVLDGEHPVELAPGTLLLLRPGDHGRIEQDESDPVSVTFCHFAVLDHTGRPVVIPPDLLPARVHHVELGGQAASALGALVRTMQGSAPMRTLRSRALLMQLVSAIYALPARLSGAAAADARLAQRAAAIVDADPSRRHSGVEVAAAIGVTARDLAPLFRTHHGMTFRDYVLESRLQRARVLVGETDIPITRIAQMLGYGDHVLLSKQFSARFGRSPRSFRHS